MGFAWVDRSRRWSATEARELATFVGLAAMEGLVAGSTTTTVKDLLDLHGTDTVGSTTTTVKDLLDLHGTDTVYCSKTEKN
jgi:hypothetical protein